MEVDFDNDLLYENDRIKSFLLEKLQGIQHSNKRVEEMIEKRKHIFSSMSANFVTESEGINVEVSHLWLKFFNSKCSIGFKIQKSTKQTLKVSKVFLDWDCLTPLNFDTHVISERDIYSSDNIYTKSLNAQGVEINDTSFVIIVFSKPQFVKKLSCTVTGNIIAEQDNINVILSLPNIEITSSDMVSKALNEPLLQGGDISDLLSVIFCSVKTEFIMIVPHISTNDLNNIFEIHCSLHFIEKYGTNKRYFSACRICPTFDNSLLEVTSLGDKHYSVVFYTKNDEALISFLHYIHQNILDVVIIPKHFHKLDTYQILESTGKNEELKQFTSNIEVEIEIVNRYKHYLEGSRKDCDVCKHLREKMLDAEKKTDLTYLRITSDI